MKMKMAAKDVSDHSNPIGWRAIIGGLIVTILGGLLVNGLSPLPFDFHSLFQSSEVMPILPEFPEARPVGTELFENSRSIQVKYGCIMLLGLTDEEQLEICNGSFNLPLEWANKVQRIAPNCAATSADWMMAVLWTGENLTGEHWDYSFDC